MSRLIEKFKNLRRVEPQPMGFVSSKASAEKPRLQIIALLSSSALEKVDSVLKSIDAAVMEISKSDDAGALDKTCQSNDSVPIGGWLSTLNSGTVKKLLNTGCDFTVFPAGAPLSITQNEKLGRVLELDLSLSETLLRTTMDLPVDAVLVSGKGDEISLTLNRVMHLQRVAYLVNKPILVSIPDSATQSDLQVLWDMGISGVVVEVSDEKSSEKLIEMKKLIEKLNPAEFRKKARVSAILPRVQSETAPPHKEDDGEEEDE